MRLIRHIVLASAAAGMFALGAGSVAADGPRPYVIGATDLQGQADWTGFYAGGQVGGAWSDIDWTMRNSNWFNSTTTTLLGTNAGFGPSGVIGGGFLGYSHQVGHWVFSGELAFNGVNLEESRASPFFAAHTFTTEVNWLADISGRIGYAWGRWLAYGRGGWAAGGVKMTLNDPVNQVTASKDTWADGYTLGGGAEYQILPRVVLGIQYDWTSISPGGESVTCSGCQPGVAGGGVPQINDEVKSQSVMGRMSYRFNPED